MMHFRNKSIADSVTERIQAIAANISQGTPIPESKGAASINLERQPDGSLLVTKTFERGEPELMTINSQAPENAIPEGFEDITPPDATSVGAVDPGGIVEAAALGGDSLDALLQG